MIKVLCLVGESGSGKSTIAELLSRDDKYNYVQSYTTRKMRGDNEVGHIFVDELVYKKHKELAENKINGFKIIAETYFCNNYYWTVNTQFLKDKINVYIVDTKGVDDLRKLKEFDVLTVYLKVDEHDRLERMLSRYEKSDKETLLNHYEKSLNRVENDREAFRIIKADYVINANRISEKILEDIKKVITLTLNG